MDIQGEYIGFDVLSSFRLGAPEIKIVLTGGGTAGHVSPLIAVFQELQKRHKSLEALFVGKQGSVEERMANEAGIDFKGLNISGLSRTFDLGGICRNIGVGANYFKAVKKAKKFLEEFGADLVFATGGYVCAPVLHAARRLKIKAVMHEQNEAPGLTTRLFKNKVDVLLLASDGSKKYFKKDDGGRRIAVVGNPVRSEFKRWKSKDAKRALKLSETGFLVVSFGGSLGARNLNKAVADAFLNVEDIGELDWIHITGEAGYDEFISILEDGHFDFKLHKNIEIRRYVSDMALLIGAADLVVARAGAMTISELQMAGKACILIPSPNVTNNHQFFNADALFKKGAVAMLEEKNLAAGRLIREIKALMLDKDCLNGLSSEMAKSAVLDSVDRICGIIEELVEGRSRDERK
ncbi:MAG: UDP-N-acetylglucosamine--N-acetylmuramyl-(pentapeptide) pyrophosphoryl-undecaprenol N-acetylglucosamine transferase [Oscillospiraceae bacterium]|nr:UDP-N-acetylglucosamine--N-acetylmuramyl-(pentapeptide) pyrophosphoryl-undecaprenol N-acetylglucosamine transferase [Oscillospiraceae bacterium]